MFDENWEMLSVVVCLFNGFGLEILIVSCVAVLTCLAECAAEDPEVG